MIHALPTPIFVQEFDQTPGMTIGVPMPAPLWATPKIIRRELSSPLFEWRVNHKLFRYRVPVVVKDYSYDYEAMQADLMRAVKESQAALQNTS